MTKKRTIYDKEKDDWQPSTTTVSIVSVLCLFSITNNCLFSWSLLVNVLGHLFSFFSVPIGPFSWSQLFLYPAIDVLYLSLWAVTLVQSYVMSRKSNRKSKIQMGKIDYLCDSLLVLQTGRMKGCCNKNNFLNRLSTSNNNSYFSNTHSPPLDTFFGEGRGGSSHPHPLFTPPSQQH